MLVCFNIALLTLFPIYLVLHFWRRKQVNLVKHVSDIVVIGIFILYIFLAAFWPFGSGYYARYFVEIFFLTFLVWHCFRFKRLTFIKATWKDHLGIGFNLLFLTILSFGLWKVVEGKQKPENTIDLSFPLRGASYYIAQGGGEQIINHHHSVSAQRYALDITKLTPTGLRTKKLFPQKLTDFPIFDQPLYSPCSGEIVEAVDQYNDHTPPLKDSEHLLGNYLAIQKKDSNIILILAHLKRDSVTKRKGDQVYMGEEIAHVGNSGNTTEPHLHIHATSSQSTDFLVEGEGIPLSFSQRYLSRNDLIKN